jgi:hypothetical protein
MPDEACCVPTAALSSEYSSHTLDPCPAAVKPLPPPPGPENDVARAASTSALVGDRDVRAAAFSPAPPVWLPLALGIAPVLGVTK